MNVRAKFTCDWNKDGFLSLSPVYSGSDENKEFFAATPGGQILLHCTRPSVVAFFQPGKEYYIDFSPAASCKV